VTDSPPFGEGFSFINKNGEKNMDRKLFFSYIQNMQQNNQDMIGFQNSMRKNSWQKPKSLVEMNGGGHVNQAAFDAEDRRRQSFEDAAEREIKGVDFADVAEKAYNDLIPQIQGRFHGFSHDPDKAYSGVETYTASNGNVIYPIDAGAHLSGHVSRGISDMASEMARERFMDALNKHHDYITGMEAEADARDWHADRQMTHGGGNPPLHESKAFSAAWRRREADPNYEKEITNETNPRASRTTETVREVGEIGLLDGIQKMAGRHLRQMGEEGYHPSAHLSGEQAEHYQDIMREIATGESGHDKRILDMIDDIKLHSGRLKPYEAVHGYAAELATQRAIGSMTRGAETSVSAAAGKTPPKYAGQGRRNVGAAIKGSVEDLRPF
jgi:hypothetical protein